MPARYVGEGGHGDQPRLVVLQDCTVEPDCALAIRIDKIARSQLCPVGQNR